MTACFICGGDVDVDAGDECATCKGLAWAARMRVLLNRHRRALHGPDGPYSFTRGPDGLPVPLGDVDAPSGVAVVLSGSDAAALQQALWRVFVTSAEIEQELAKTNSSLRASCAVTGAAPARACGGTPRCPAGAAKGGNDHLFVLALRQ